MLFLTLCVLTLQAAPEDPLPNIVRLLGDDAVEVREKASAELIRLGEGRRADLLKALQEASSPEVAGRLRAAIGKFDVDKRRREFKGGSIVEDLGASLTCDYDDERRELTATLALTNLGSHDRAIVAVTSWNRNIPRESWASSSAEAEVDVRQTKGEHGLGGSYTSTRCCGGEPARSALSLRPGETRTFKTTVKVAKLGPGEYEVTAKFLAKRLLGLSDDVVANAVTFTVTR